MHLQKERKAPSFLYKPIRKFLLLFEFIKMILVLNKIKNKNKNDIV